MGRPPPCLLLAAATLVIILIVVALSGASAARRHLSWVSGVWSGDPSWMRSAQVEDFLLFVGPGSPAGEFSGYLRIVSDDGQVVTSQAFTLRATPPGRLVSLRAALSARPGRDTVKIPVSLEFDEADGPPPPIPAALSLSLSTLEGTMALLDDQKIYAFLAKDVYSSSVALQAYSG